MDWLDSAEQAEFRAEVRHVIDTRLPARYQRLAESGGGEGRQWEFDRKSENPEARAAAVSWHHALNERGWVAPAWPKELGGAGLTAMEQFILNQELARKRAASSTAFVVIAVVGSVLVAGCGDKSPNAATPTSTAIRPPDVQLQLSNSNAYYVVKGMSTEEIFASIDGNGLLDDGGSKAVGITAQNLSYKESHVAMSGASCVLVSVTVHLDIVVTLPQLQTVNLVTPDLRSRWNDYSARIAAHEQRHVDIAVTGAKELKALFEMVKPEALGCEVLGKAINDLWQREIQKTGQAQDQFHADENARLAPILSTLKKVVDGYHTQLAGLESEIASLNSSADSLGKQIEALTPQLTSLQQHADSIRARYPSLVLPPGTYEDYQATVGRYTALLANQNQLIDQRNGVVTRQNALVTRHDGLLAAAQQANENYNWAQS